MTRFRRSLLLVATAAVGAFAGVAQAQTPSPAPSQDTPSALDEIIVVARRREENIQTVPVAVSAVSGQTIERAGITSVGQLGQQTLALVIAPTTSRATPAFAIRGQRQQDYLPTVDQSVAVYFGDLYLSRQFGIDQALFDIQSVILSAGALHSPALLQRSGIGPRRPWPRSASNLSWMQPQSAAICVSIGSCSCSSA